MYIFDATQFSSGWKSYCKQGTSLSGVNDLLVAGTRGQILQMDHSPAWVAWVCLDRRHAFLRGDTVEVSCLGTAKENLKAAPYCCGISYGCSALWITWWSPRSVRWMKQATIVCVPAVNFVVPPQTTVTPPYLSVVAVHLPCPHPLWRRAAKSTLCLWEQRSSYAGLAGQSCYTLLQRWSWITFLHWIWVTLNTTVAFGMIVACVVPLVALLTPLPAIWREEHPRNLSVLQRVGLHLSGLFNSCVFLITRCGRIS
jgi:hypothetical protein